MTDKAASMKQVEAGDEDKAADGLDVIVRLRDKTFEGSVEKLALALGRPTDEVQEWISGGAAMDEDAVEKANALAQERGAGSAASTDA